MRTSNFIATLIGVAFTLLPAQAGTLVTLPISPKIGEQIQLEYTPMDADKAMMDRKNIHAVVYTFTAAAELPLAIEVPLEKRSGRFTGALVLPKDAVYAIIKVGNGSIYDTNKELYWEVLQHNEKGQPVEGADLKSAMARYGQLPAPCRMKDDFEEALEYLNKETRLYPKNVVAQFNYIMIAKNTGDLTEDEAKGKYRELTSQVTQIQGPLEAIAVAQAYAEQGKQEESERIMVDAARRFPTSTVSEQAQLQELGASKSLDEFVGRATEHLQKWSSSPARQNIIDAVLNATTQQRAMPQLVQFIQSTAGLSARTIHQAVNFIGAVDTLRTQALAFVESGISAARDESRKPQNMGISEWKEEQRLASSQLRFVQGAILRAMGRNNEAITALEQSIEIGGDDLEKGCVEMLVDMRALSGQKKSALQLAERALSLGVSTPKLLETFRALLKEDGEDSSDIAEREEELRSQGRQRMAMRVVKDMLHQQAIDGAFTSLDGKAVKIFDWKGKVVIIDYWATWCGPCRQSFPSLQKLYMRYKDNPNVVFAIVNVWERSDDRVQTVKDFLSKNPTLTFPMFLDKDDSVVGKFGVTGIPTKFYLGKDGRIQFKEVGLSPEEQFLDEATNRIEALLAQ
ncbi:MAG: redoxin domain-containing protein [Ignavibacteria bacterium]|nr:redoxin domain-containing protein [Ignavibacteria bacterium]